MIPFRIKIDRYVLGEVVQPWLGLCAFFFMTFLLFQTLRLADFLIVHHAPPSAVGEIALLLLLSFSPLVFPIAFLGAVMMAFGRLSADSELVAMKAAGMSLVRLIRPVLIFGVCVCALTLWISLELAPWGELTMTRALYRAGNIKPVQAIQSKTFNDEFFGLMLYVDEVEEKTGVLKNVFIYDEREVGNPLVVVAPFGIISELKSTTALSRKNLLELHNGTLHRRSKLGEPLDRIDFKTYKLFLQMETAPGPEPNNTRILSSRTLVTRIVAAHERHQTDQEAVTEFMKRVSVATTPLIFVFLGAGLGSIRGRTVASRAYVMTLLVALGYWQSLIFAVAFSSNPILNPWWVMIVPSVLAILVAAWTFRRASW